jgi:hypothetical protein
MIAFCIEGKSKTLLILLEKSIFVKTKSMKQYLIRLALTAVIVMTAASVQGQYITTYAGTGFVTGYSGDGGLATNAVLYSPSDIAFDSSNNLYIADFINNVIRKVDTAGIITTVAGTGYGSGTAGMGNYSGDGGPATDATMNGPFGLAIDAAGNIIFADGYNHVVRKVKRSTGVITTIAGIHSAGYTGDGAAATDAQMNNPVGIAIDKAGNIYIADDHNNVIRKVSLSGIITTVVGTGGAGRSGDGGPATAAKLNLPIGLALDTAGNLYIADTHNNVIRKVAVSGIITTCAGIDTAGYSGDGGLAVNAKLDSPQRVAFDDSNNMYISDYYNNVVRKVNTVTGIITTVAGNGYGAGSSGTMGGYSGDDSLATNAMLYLPHGVAFDHAHHMYICDRGNDAIRRLGPQPPIDHTFISPLAGNTNVKLVVYPNPSHSGSFTLLLTSKTKEQMKILVTNILGQTVQTTTGLSNAPIMINMNTPAGVYFITATSAHGKWNSKITIE